MSKQSKKQRKKLDALAELARATIIDLVGPSDDHHYFEVDDLENEQEISEGEDGTWVRGWILVDNQTLKQAGLK